MCVSKVKVFNRFDGKYYYHSCGKCEECLNAKSLRLQELCEVESLNRPYCLFCTLTYAPDYLPMVKYNVSNIPYKKVSSFVVDLPFSTKVSNVFKECVDTHYKQLRFYPACERLSKFYNYDKIDEYNYYTDEQIDSLNKFLLPLTSNKFKIKYNRFGVLHYPDVQKFMKLWRYYVERDLSLLLFNQVYKKLSYDEKKKVRELCKGIKVFIVGEYGPKTFRPHWHMLCYSSEYLVAESFRKCIHKAWRMGRIDCQYSSKSARNYVASYANSFACLPPLLQLHWSKVMARHSIYIGVTSCKELNKDISQIRYRNIVETLKAVNGKLKCSSLSFSLENNLFPRTYRFDKSSDYVLLVRYQLYNRLSQAFSTKSVEGIIKKVYSKDITCHWLYDLHHTLSNSDICFDSLNVESTLRSILYQSKKFIRNCLKYNLSPYQYLQIIKNYYNEKDYYFLQNSLSNMELLGIESNYKPIYLINYYNNMARDFDSLQDDEMFIMFASSINENFTNVIKQSFHPQTNPFLNSRYVQACNIFRSKIKHKELNDLNKIFL